MVLYEKVFDAEKIISTLEMIDALCLKKNITANILIVGGSAFSLFLAKNNRRFRFTMDIDFANEPFQDYPDISDFLHRAGIEHVRGVLMPDATEIQQELEYMEYLHPFSTIKVYTPTPEMLVCIKALTNRKKDFNDIMDSGILDFCDVSRTITLIEEYRGYLLNPDPLYFHVDEVLEVLRKR